jgi:hypothetical protein
MMMLNLHKNVLEIGCLNGYSTSAFITALKNRAEFDFTICDKRMDRDVIRLAKSSPKEVSIKECRSVEVIDPSFDFIFVDGDHTISSVGPEIKLLLESETKSILAHDTFITHVSKFWGAVLLRQVFSNHRDYWTVQDHSTNEHFRRLGLSFFTRDEEIHKAVKPLFENIT